MSFHDQQYSEKRDFMRMTVETAATLTFGADNHTCDVLCRDLSNQGAQVMASEAVAEGTVATLSIPSPTPGMQGLQAKGEVVRCQAESDGRFSIGLRFDSLS
ncbi:PilZ domain-containing protein [Halopseudomonas oceani]|uniref:PilZ domain-containing protein n=1 Tax=Halopseudomonas oceani TaxID=1708783 RepID=A0A2P4EU39_9GAMM|nr:PilZ domain-containing protein [Halopseudomonas oceani]POB02967.1 PilZ domain-containing protein [Halopseudomonas oceani]GGE50120.1 PilZ domain-containing protein [Halopseudomonas oceani]